MANTIYIAEIDRERINMTNLLCPICGETGFQMVLEYNEAMRIICGCGWKGHISDLRASFRSLIKEAMTIGQDACL